MTSDWTKVLNKASSKETASRKMSKTGLEKKGNLEFQLVLWASSSHILPAQGHFLLVLVNDFVIGSVADPDPQMGGGGGGKPDPDKTEDMKKNFRLFRPQFGLKTRKQGPSNEDDLPGTLPIGQVS